MTKANSRPRREFFIWYYVILRSQLPFLSVRSSPLLFSLHVGKAVIYLYLMQKTFLVILSRLSVPHIPLL